ncbi:MAG TPA: M1 family aminopeptidase, partial [Thermoanaerobaculia bacterium]|nr:M1 family aminopeptidase [Thermoanaerobaculia bacterium]
RVIDYHVQYATYFAFVAGAFHVHERSAAVPLKAYLLSERNNAGTWLDGVAAIVAVLQKEFGTYPFEELSFVEIPRDVATAASFNAAALQGFILLNHRSLDVPDISLLWEWIAHEVGHMWFPHYVSFTRPGGRFMEEALAQYGAQRVVEALGGSDLARQSRISGYPPDPIYSATAYFRLVDGGIDHPIGALQRLPGHSDLAYTKGSMVFHMLSRSVGRERFRDALRKTTNASPYQTMPWWKFLSELERHAAVDLSAFYDQWFHRVGAPSWTFTWRNVDQAVEVTIRQTEPAYTLDLPIRVTVQDGAIVETEIRVVSSEETHLIPSIPAINVELDPDFHVLHRPNAVPSEKVGKMRQVLERLGSYTERRHEFSRELKALPRRPSDHGR